jgi:hypothetical protein
MIFKRFSNKMCPNFDQEEVISRIKSAFCIVIGVVLLATLVWTISTTPKKTSQVGANGDQYEKEPVFFLADKPNRLSVFKGLDKVIRLMRTINRGFTITFVVATHNEPFTAFSVRMFELHSRELSETLPS